MSPTSTDPASRTPGHSDGSLVRQLHLGKATAAERLYKRYADRIRALARRELTTGLAGRVDADDIVQSVFRRFFHAVGQGRYDLPSGEELGDLLVAITLNRVRSEEEFHRAARRDVRRTVSGEELAKVTRAGGGDGLAPELSLALVELIEQLSPDHRQVVIDRLEGREVTEIAARMGRSKRTVERMLQEARTQLRNLLEVKSE